MNVQFDVASREFVITGDPSPYGQELRAVLVRHGNTIPLSGVRFGFSLSRGGEVVDKKDWPPEGVTLIQTDQDLLVTHTVSWVPDEEVEISAWLQDTAGVRHEAVVTFTAPRPPQPFESWTWSGLAWMAPVPYPDDGQSYTWDEESLSWAVVEPPDAPSNVTT